MLFDLRCYCMFCGAFVAQIVLKYNMLLHSIFGLLNLEKRKWLSPSDIFTPYGRDLLEGALMLRIYRLFLRKKFIRGVLFLNKNNFPILTIHDVFFLQIFYGFFNFCFYFSTNPIIMKNIFRNICNKCFFCCSKSIF